MAAIDEPGQCVHPFEVGRLSCDDGAVEISAKSDYAVRALLGLAARYPGLVKADVLLAEQPLPRKFAESILGDLRRAASSAASAEPKAATHWRGHPTK